MIILCKSPREEETKVGTPNFISSFSPLEARKTPYTPHITDKFVESRAGTRHITVVYSSPQCNSTSAVQYLKINHSAKKQFNKQYYYYQ